MKNAPHLKDEELIRMYLHTKQSDYFETLYNRYVSKVYRRCLSLIKDTAQAEDYTHDIFIRVYGNLGNFKEHSAFSTWLYSISYNYCIDQIRYTNRTATIALEEDHEHIWTDVPEQENLETQSLQLMQILGSLSADEVQLLRLKYEEGMDVKTIARQFNLKDSAVKMRLKRTRDKIRQLYQERYA